MASDEDIDMYDDDDLDVEYSSDDNSEPDNDLENNYYTGKSLRDDEPEVALKKFEKVLETEKQQSQGIWGYKSLKQMMKIYFKLGRYSEMVEKYKILLTYIKSAVTRNYSEKSITSLLEHISTSKQFDLLQSLYTMTLEALREAKNERLWLKTNIKLGLLYLNMRDFTALQRIIKELHESCQTETGEDDMRKGTQLLEIYALWIQMYTAQKNNKKLKVLYNLASEIKRSLAHPMTMGIILECGGKMHLREGEYEKAHSDFFEAFKSFDTCGSSRRITCLKYLVLANMLTKSQINPFESQETKAYKNDPQITAMTDMVYAYQNKDIDEFENILKTKRDAIMEDEFIREHIEDLLRNIRMGGLIKLLRPYSSVRIRFIAEKLKLSESEIESLLVACILDNSIQAQIDQENGLLVMNPVSTADARYQSIQKLTGQLRQLQMALARRIPST